MPSLPFPCPWLAPLGGEGGGVRGGGLIFSRKMTGGVAGGRQGGVVPVTTPDELIQEHLEGYRGSYS